MIKGRKSQRILNMKNIEDIFREKASENSAYECLVTHWNVVKENASKVLSCVKMIFPHYTLHDESHSRAILENIQRVLGNDVVCQLRICGCCCVQLTIMTLVCL